MVCAILRDVTFNQERYESFIDLQDQLHRNLCRMRTLVAIGTHDYDELSGPFEYHAKTPKDINFVPLTETNRSFNAKELMEHYETDPSCKHLKPYVPIIKDEVRRARNSEQRPVQLSSNLSLRSTLICLYMSSPFTPSYTTRRALSCRCLPSSTAATLVFSSTPRTSSSSALPLT